MLCASARRDLLSSFISVFWLVCYCYCYVFLCDVFLLWKQSKLVVNDQGLMLALILFLHCRKCSTCSWGLYRIFHYPHSFWSGKSFMFPFFLPNCKALGMQCILMITKNTENHNFEFFFSEISVLCSLSILIFRYLSLKGMERKLPNCDKKFQLIFKPY